jgi:Zn-dependent M28 family amino/carboxypeptidase
MMFTDLAGCRVVWTRACGTVATMVILAAAFPAGAGDPQSGEARAGSAARIEADVRFLADDLLEGREAGTRGFDLAALYVATQYRLVGLEPAGENGTFFQAVPMVRGVRERDGARFAITRDGAPLEFTFESDFLPAVNYTAGAAEITAPMVFVGQGVRAPELQHDDFAGVDVKDKIVVLFDNAPARFPIDQRAFHASSTEKLRELARLGAAGAIFLGDPVSDNKRPWALTARNWRRPGMRRIDADGQPADDFPAIAVRVSAGVHLADALFAGSPHTAAEVFAWLEAGKLRAFDLAGEATLATRARLERVASHNVVGRLAGRDAQLSREHVAFIAHLDHLGIGAAVDGDVIYNGAQDNAVGVATLLETARLLSANPERPKRSMLFLALTAEEKGLLGAFQFAAEPTVPRRSLVATINLDMPLPLSDASDVVAIGIEHSTLQSVAERAVAEAGLAMTPDPFADEVLFVRSDQYPFVREGVPAIVLLAGVKPRDGSDGLQRFREFLAARYHQPSDDLNHPIHWLGAADLAMLNFRIGLAVGNDPERPAWNPGDFFGETFGR